MFTLHWFTAFIIVICTCSLADSIYVQNAVASFHQNSQRHHQLLQHHYQNDQHKSNSINDRQIFRATPPVFKDDVEISRYVKLHKVDFIVWRCKNAIQPAWLKLKSLPSIDLYCEVIGTMKSVEWLHNNRRIVATSGEKVVTKRAKYGHVIEPHYADRHGYYSRWIEFTLTIDNVTRKDAGQYTFKVTSPSGYSQQQHIYIDLPPPPPHRPQQHQQTRRRRNKQLRNSRMRSNELQRPQRVRRRKNNKNRDKND